MITNWRYKAICLRNLSIQKLQEKRALLFRRYISDNKLKGQMNILNGGKGRKEKLTLGAVKEEGEIQICSAKRIELEIYTTKCNIFDLPPAAMDVSKCHSFEFT